MYTKTCRARTDLHVLSCNSSHRDNLRGHKCTHFGFQPVTHYEKRISKSVNGLVTDQSVTQVRTTTVEIQHKREAKQQRLGTNPPSCISDQ